jgi:rare lipoprotein A
MFVLSEGLIKQQFTKSLAAAVLLSAVGATAASAQTLGPISNALNAVSASENSRATGFADASATTAQPVISGLSAEDSLALDSAASGDELIPSLDSDILVHSHALDGRQAATLYVRNIPVLTFIGTEVDSLSRTGDAVAIASSAPAALEVSATAPADSSAADSSAADSSTADSSAADSSTDEALEADPVLRATSLGNQLDSATMDATDISVRWNEQTEGYTVTLADADLISLDNRTILADTTNDPAEDALQVTNRLRRLIGSAEPISEIEGLPEPPAPAQTVAIVSTNVGGASWYGPGFDGRLSASGEVFNQNALTAAHRTLPFGTRVMVTNLNNGRQVTVRINDRGPYSGGRIIDLSAGAAAEIGLINSGVATVQLDVLAN